MNEAEARAEFQRARKLRQLQELGAKPAAPTSPDERNPLPDGSSGIDWRHRIEKILGGAYLAGGEWKAPRGDAASLDKRFWDRYKRNDFDQIKDSPEFQLVLREAMERLEVRKNAAIDKPAPALKEGERLIDALRDRAREVSLDDFEKGRDALHRDLRREALEREEARVAHELDGFRDGGVAEGTAEKNKGQ